MSETIVVAAIAALPPTIMAYASLRESRKAKVEAAGANAATNHQGPGQPSLVEMVKSVDQRTRGLVDEVQTLTRGQDELHGGVARCTVAIGELDLKVDRHLATHQADRELHAAERADDEHRRIT